MHANDYSTAVTELLLEGQSIELVLEKLNRLLIQKGHQKLYPKILSIVHTKLIKSIEEEKTTVVVGREKDIDILKYEIKNALTTLNEANTYATITDPTIVGGFIIKQSDRILDKSYKSQLITIYRALIE